MSPLLPGYQVPREQVRCPRSPFPAPQLGQGPGLFQVCLHPRSSGEASWLATALHGASRVTLQGGRPQRKDVPESPGTEPCPLHGHTQGHRHMCTHSTHAARVTHLHAHTCTVTHEHMSGLTHALTLGLRPAAVTPVPPWTVRVDSGEPGHPALLRPLVSTAPGLCDRRVLCPDPELLGWAPPRQAASQTAHTEVRKGPSPAHAHNSDKPQGEETRASRTGAGIRRGARRRRQVQTAGPTERRGARAQWGARPTALPRHGTCHSRPARAAAPPGRRAGGAVGLVTRQAGG